jgi:4-carboxymuconolactone decarboxylase
MEISERSEQYRKKIISENRKDLSKTDPDFIERFDYFAFDEVVSHDDLPEKTRAMAIIASLIGCQGTDAFRITVPAAMEIGVTPEEIKEIVYQSVDYCGMGRALPFLEEVNEIFEERGISLPLGDRSTTTKETRLEAGIRAQMDIFGEGMKDFWRSGPEESRHINKWLAENCFGDYYTRKGLDLRQREMITFCFLSAQGGCEPQLTAHARANMRIGNDKGFLIKIISQCLPYIGYPRSLNALRCVNEAAK